MLLREIYAMQGIVISTQQVEDKPLAAKLPPDNSSFELGASISQPSNVFEPPQYFDRGDPGMSQTSTLPFTFPPPPLPPTHKPLHTSCEANVPAVSNPQPSTIPVSNPVGPPPLSGFVKRSAFTR